jgi:Tfp pilus assembly protein PilF
MNRTAAIALGIAILAGCAAPQPEAPAQPPPKEAPPPPKPEPPQPVRPAVGSPEARAQAQQLLRHAFESLNDGDDQKARTELDELRELEPDNKQAACLLKGITADPASALGKQANPYTVRPGESLGSIARRALGDVCEFWLLARYNSIKVPKQLGAGQTIRIPGKVALAPPDAAPGKPAAAPAPVPVAPAPPEPAKPPAAETAVIKEPAKPAGPGKEEIAKREQIQRHHRNAQAAFRRQDLATAIREWDRVLELDPSNELAQARRQEALDMSRRLKELK